MFNKCVSKPGPSLNSTEQKCVSMCKDHLYGNSGIYYYWKYLNVLFILYFCTK